MIGSRFTISSVRRALLKASVPFLCLALSGCMTPYQTHIDNKSISSLPAQASFLIAEQDEKPNTEWLSAKDQIVQSLAAKGYKTAENAPYSLHILLSNRAATIGFSVIPKGKKQAETVAPSEKAKPCRGQRYSLSVSIVEISTGNLQYSGSAMECHKKANLTQTLPFLVSSALSNLDSTSSKRLSERPSGN